MSMTTILIRINDEEINIPAPCFLNHALEAWSKQNGMKNYVIALNQTFIPRHLYNNTRLNSGDSIELLSPMAGG